MPSFTSIFYYKETIKNNKIVFSFRRVLVSLMENAVTHATTARDLMAAAAGHSMLTTGVLVAVPVIALMLQSFHPKGKGADAPWKYFYAALVYIATVPGMLSAVLTGYTLFFTHENLLDVNLVVYFLPMASMITTLAVIRRAADFKDIPGFDRLSGLMAMIGMSFVAVLVVSKTRIWLVFGGSIYTFFALAAVVFALIKWGAYMFFRSPGQPKTNPPKFPDVYKGG